MESVQSGGDKMFIKDGNEGGNRIDWQSVIRVR